MRLILFVLCTTRVDFGRPSLSSLGEGDIFADGLTLSGGDLANFTTASKSMSGNDSTSEALLVRSGILSPCMSSHCLP